MASVRFNPFVEEEPPFMDRERVQWRLHETPFVMMRAGHSA